MKFGIMTFVKCILIYPIPVLLNRKNVIQQLQMQKQMDRSMAMSMFSCKKKELESTRKYCDV